MSHCFPENIKQQQISILSLVHTKDDNYKDNYISATPANDIVCLF